MTNEQQTSWDDRREFEERLARGERLTVSETADLIADADAAERAVAVLEALEQTLKKSLGISIVDFSTDDDQGQIRLELVRDALEEPKDSIGE